MKMTTGTTEVFQIIKMVSTPMTLHDGTAIVMIGCFMDGELLHSSIRPNENSEAFYALPFDVQSTVSGVAYHEFLRFEEERNQADILTDKKLKSYDELNESIGKFYESDDDEDPEGDLCDIGEIAASAFGYL